MNTQETTLEFRVLNDTELDEAAGGFWADPVDVSGMPDRFVGGCGTMWYWEQLMKKMGLPT